MANDALHGRMAAGAGQDPDEEYLGRVVSAYVRAVPVPGELAEGRRQSRRAPAVRWVGGGAVPLRPPGALAAVAAGVAVVALAVVIGLAGRTTPPQVVASPGVTVPPVASVAPSESGSSVATPVPSAPSPAPTGTPAAPNLAGSAWFTMAAFGGCPVNFSPEPLSDCAGTTGRRPGSLELFVGTLDGRTTLHVKRALPVPAHLAHGRGYMPDAAGPFGGKVLYNIFDGARSELHVVDAKGGSDKTVLTTDNIVYNAVLDPSSGQLYFGQLDASTRHDLGVWRLRLGSSAQPEQFLGAVAHAYGGSWQWLRTLHITPDGGRLVVRDCQNAKCAIKVYATSDAHLVASASGLGYDTVYGVTDTVLVSGMGCSGGTCSIGTVDLASGRVGSVTADACAVSASGVIGARADGTPVLLTASAPGAGCPPAGSVIAIDLANSLAQTAWTSDGGDAGSALWLALQMQGSQGYAAPDGWALVAPGQELGRTEHTGSQVPELVSLSGGAVIPVPVQPVFAP